jgi:hypothetical protein|tara:strand:- start:2319 stop:2732 length:414 start_codon:yes stop_codon:yes gene_type:complete
MVENFDNIFYLILYLLNLIGLLYYGYLCILSPNTLVDKFNLGERGRFPIRVIGTFILPIIIIGIWILFRENGPEGCWIYFVMGVLISLFQVILDWGQRFKIIDNDLENINDTSDTIIGIAFLIIGIILINGLSDKIY